MPIGSVKKAIRKKKKYENEDDKILQDHHIRIGKTEWKGGIYVSGIDFSYEDEIDMPLSREIQRFYEENFTKNSFKGFVFSGCRFNDSMLTSLRLTLITYQKKYNKKTFVSRTSYFQNCRFQAKDSNVSEEKESVFFSEQIGFKNWDG